MNTCEHCSQLDGGACGNCQMRLRAEKAEARIAELEALVDEAADWYDRGFHDGVDSEVSARPETALPRSLVDLLEELAGYFGAGSTVIDKGYHARLEQALQTGGTGT